MASTTGGEAPAMPPTEANAPAMVMDAKLMVAKSHGDCQKLKDLVNQQDAMTMVVVVASSNQASEEKPSLVIMHPLLAETACKGNWEELNFLLNREDPQAQPSKIPGQEFLEKLVAYSSGSRTNRSSEMQQTTADVEEGIDTMSLLNGVTVEGDTALHLVAANGDDGNFVNCADLIHGKDKEFLCRQNNLGDTPLHCAAIAGKSKLVSHLIDLARGDNIMEELLRKENNSKETALHGAVRIGDNQIVKVLLEADRELACFPRKGTSPLYLAILLKEDHIVKTLHDHSKDGVLSYSGPKGQNALHAAVLRGPVLTRRLLEWNTNKDLTTERDENGSTPLHFAAGLPGAHRRGSVCWQVFKANTAALYQPDNDGLCPIHVAASVGVLDAIASFVEKCPSNAGLRDAKGRTFLHVAVEKKKVRVVWYACRNRSLARILNMQDNDGNTALHLAVQAGSLRMFSALLLNRQVRLNLSNEEGQTPLDIARCKIPRGMYHPQNSEPIILQALNASGAWSGALRLDHFEDNHKHIWQLQSGYEVEELEKLKDTTQSLCIGSVLITTVTFGATFALPGGYRADDHTNGGAPTLAGTYAFDAFMIANTIGFTCSALATIGFMYSGSPVIHLVSRRFYMATSYYFMKTSITALTATFALGAYMVLHSVAHKTAIAICILSPLVVVWNHIEFWGKQYALTELLCVRRGLCWTLPWLLVRTVQAALLQFWPLIFIFCWSAYPRNHSIQKMGN